MRNMFFSFGAATLITHELDAMSNHEWRVLPLTSWLPDEYGMLVFLFAHIPFFAVLLGLLASKRDHIRFLSRIGISVFLVVHGFLHALFWGNTNYEFASIASKSLIFGGALIGLIHLISEYAVAQNRNA